jgi:hypothetical protein
MALTISCNVNNNIPGVAQNDIYLNSDGNISTSVDLQAVLENCSQAAKTLLGELIFSTDQGIPYFETVWSGIVNIEQFTSSLRQAFLQVTGVIEIVSLITSRGDNVNTLQYSAVIRTIYGSGALSGNL